jgi:uncharacterized surface protein with fasciclin (FAS1) repeats
LQRENRENNKIKGEIELKAASFALILSVHVVSGDVTAAQVGKLSSAITVNGQDLKLTVNDGTVMVNDAKVVKADVLASNGVIHVIDTVLLPKD